MLSFYHREIYSSSWFLQYILVKPLYRFINHLLTVNVIILVFTLRPRKPLDIEKIRQMKDPKLAVHMGQVGLRCEASLKLSHQQLSYLSRSVNFIHSIEFERSREVNQETIIGYNSGTKDFI